MPVRSTSTSERPEVDSVQVHSIEGLLSGGVEEE
jgi:hypothetical protein